MQDKIRIKQGGAEVLSLIHPAFYLLHSAVPKRGGDVQEF
jgi:hypothetical protein